MVLNFAQPCLKKFSSSSADCDLIQTGQDVVEVMTSMQQVVDSSTDEVEVTGGALEP